MKTNRIAWVLLFLMLGVAGAQQQASPNWTNSTSKQATHSFDQSNTTTGTSTFHFHNPDFAEQRRSFRTAEPGLANEQAGSKTKPLSAVLFDDIPDAADRTPTVAEKQLFNETKAEAEKGNAGAQFALADSYFIGGGVAQSVAEAIKWYRKSAEQGYAPAQAFLGVCYYQGVGVSRDYSLAVKWFQKAAEQGDAQGQAMLGGCYGEGKGVPVNDIEAYKWLSLAVAHEWRNSSRGGRFPDEFGDSFRNSVLASFNFCQARMSREEVVEAQRLASEFTPRKKSVSANSSSSGNPSASGTGVFISEDGFLVTNEHVVRGAAQFRLATSAGLISAKVVKVDAANDLALLKAEGRFAALPVAPSRGVKLGGTVATVGFPNIGLQGFAPKLAKGEIASLSGAGDDARYFQISVPVQPGNSGGALVDERGNVVGVVSAKLSAKAALAASGALPENVNYAVKSSYLLSFLESVPEVASKLKEPSTKDKKFEDVVKEAEQAAVLVLIY